MGIANPRGKWSNIFWQRIANPLERLTGDFLIENQPERLAGDFLIENQPEPVVLAIVLEWNTKKEDGDCKSPGGKWSNIFWQRIANPLERLAEDFLIENQPERLAEDFLIENQPERLAGDFQIENQPERLTGDLLIENPPERLAEDFLIVRWTNNTKPKRAVFWFKSTITTI